jgi:hypothetical protein
MSQVRKYEESINETNKRVTVDKNISKREKKHIRNLVTLVTPPWTRPTPFILQTVLFNTKLGENRFSLGCIDLQNRKEKEGPSRITEETRSFIRPRKETVSEQKEGIGGCPRSEGSTDGRGWEEG